MNKTKHIPSGFCYSIVDSEDKAFKPTTVYSGADVIDTFLNSLLSEVKDILPFEDKNPYVYE